MQRNRFPGATHINRMGLPPAARGREEGGEDRDIGSTKKETCRPGPPIDRATIAVLTPTTPPGPPSHSLACHSYAPSEISVLGLRAGNTIMLPLSRG